MQISAIPKHSLEGMPLIGLLHGLQHRLVHPEADGGREGGKGQVGSHADHAELGQGEEEQEHAAKHGSGLLHIPPVEQIDRCGRGRKRKVRALTLGTIPSSSLPLSVPVAGSFSCELAGGVARRGGMLGCCERHWAHVGQITGSCSHWARVLGEPQRGHVICR